MSRQRSSRPAGYKHSASAPPTPDPAGRAQADDVQTSKPTPHPRRRFKWTAEDDTLLRELYPDHPASILEAKLRRSSYSIESRVKRLGLFKTKEFIEESRRASIEKANAACRINSVNHGYFSSLETAGQAYWLGWLWADGSVRYHRGSYQIKLELQSRDIDIVRRFAEAVESDYHISCGDRSCSTILISQRMFSDLSRYGIVPRKTYAGLVPMIPTDLVADFVRGVFDGDGCVTGRGKKIQLRIIGSEPFCLWLREAVREATGLSGGGIYRKSSEHIREFIVGGRRQVALVAAWLYAHHDGDPPLCLLRKHKRFVEAGILAS